MSLRLAVERLPAAADLPLPAYQTEGSAGLDLTAAGFDHGDGSVVPACHLGPGERVLVRTGLRVAVPEGYVGLVCPRSGLALRNGLTLLNTPGVLDSDYRGEVCVILINHGSGVFRAERGMRLAQLVLVACERAVVELTAALPPSGRGAGGFGSTGV